LRIVFLEDARGRKLLEESLRGLSRDVHDKVERALSVLERSTWQEALEGKLVSQLGKPGDRWVYEIQINGNPSYRIAALPARQGEVPCLLIGTMVTRETLNKKHDKDSFMNRALEAGARWRG
jgi:hypothetical protein